MGYPERSKEKPKHNEAGAFTREWRKIEKRDIGLIAAYLLYMGYDGVVIMGYNEMVKQFVDAVHGTGVNLVVQISDDEFCDEKRVPVTKSLSESLQICRNAKLVLETDISVYKLRRATYDRYTLESCMLSDFLKRVNETEIFDWFVNDYPYYDEMFSEFIDIVDMRYKSILVYGNGQLARKMHSAIAAKCGAENTALITQKQVKLSDAGRMMSIKAPLEKKFDAILYFGIVQEINVVQDGLKVDAINHNSICAELAMSYDLAVNVLPVLKAGGVKVFTYLYPEIFTLNYMLKARGLETFKRTPFLHMMVKDKKYDLDIRKFFCELYSPEYVEGILTRPQAVEVNGVRKYADFHTDFYNTVNGCRLTTNVPEHPIHTIHFFGKCVAMGRFVEDKYTIPSQLQRYINIGFDQYQVINYGVEADTAINKKLRNIKVRDGDIVIILYRHYEVYRKKGIEVNYLLDLIMNLTREKREYFLDSPEHFNHVVNNKIAEYIYMSIEDELRDDYEESDHYFSMSDGTAPDLAPPYPELAEFIENLKKYRVKTTSGKIGAIVMNCNPFTLGHRYLIETASKQVEQLYVFVVEEDKSIFSFKDRFMLVQQGTAHLPNVTVLPSGNFMISTLTFPEYFNKDNVGSATIDPSNDVELFANYIAPALNIKIRFAGEEPLDMVTRQYNETMKRILPACGMEFRVIPRLESGGEVISASRVRRCLEKKDFATISRIVPETTLRYLISNFG
ncbi:MAG: adenylyltransferase/cytidyltransferase family protein [Firmicutes bacterium]|nr:adenylyltransferase/cytidyltransferase family protein [Bacillota bacterium]